MDSSKREIIFELKRPLLSAKFEKSVFQNETIEWGHNDYTENNYVLEVF